MSLRDRLRRLRQKAEEGGVLIYQADGSVRRFDVMYTQAEMYLALCDLLRDTARDSDVLDAVRNATLASRAAFEERFGSIRIATYILTPMVQGGQVEMKLLTEDGEVLRVLYAGDSEEATLVREGAQAGTTSRAPKELPLPPVAGQWLYGADDKDLSE